MREFRTWLCWLVLMAMPAGATSYAPPKREEVLSANGEFLLVVHPESEVHEVKLMASPETTLWSFEHGVWHFPFFVANDGQTVAVLAWRHVQEKGLADGVRATFYGAGGEEVKIPFKDVYPNPPKTVNVGIGPIGDFWRTWYHDAWSDGETFTIETTGGGEAIFGFPERALLEKSGVGWRKPFAGPVGSIKTLLWLVFFLLIVWLVRRKYRRKSRRGN